MLVQNMLVQIFTGFPFIDQAETVLVFDIPEDVMAQQPLSFPVDSIIERSVCMTSFRFSGRACMAILTMITEAPFPLFQYNIIPIGAKPLTGCKSTVSLLRTVFKQIQTVQNYMIKLRARLEKFNDIELNALIYHRKFIYERLPMGRELNIKLWLHMTNGHI